jgi:hypothetical protein
MSSFLSPSTNVVFQLVIACLVEHALHLERRYWFALKYYANRYDFVEILFAIDRSIVVLGQNADLQYDFHDHQQFK